MSWCLSRTLVCHLDYKMQVSAVKVIANGTDDSSSSAADGTEVILASVISGETGSRPER